MFKLLINCKIVNVSSPVSYNSACYHCCSTLEQLQLANETLQTENKRLISEMDELRTQVDHGHCFVFILKNVFYMCLSFCLFFISWYICTLQPVIQAIYMLHYSVLDFLFYPEK